MGKWFRIAVRIITAPARLIFWLLKFILQWIITRFKKIWSFFTHEPDDTPLTQTFEKAIQSPTSFLLELLAHLAELRWHLIRISVALLIASVIAFSYTEIILDWLSQPVGGIDELTAIDITEPVRVAMRISLLAGFLITLPYMFFEVLLFVADGIKRRARIIFLLLIPIITILFAGGMAFAYIIMLPIAIPFLQEFMGIKTIPRPDSYVRFVTAVMFWMGVASQFPIASYWLAAIGLVHPSVLLKKWRIAVVIIAILAAVITPTPDPVNMMIVFIPLLALYFFGIISSLIAENSRKRKTKKQSEKQN